MTRSLDHAGDLRHAAHGAGSDRGAFACLGALPAAFCSACEGKGGTPEEPNLVWEQQAIRHAWA